MNSLMENTSVHAPKIATIICFCCPLLFLLYIIFDHFVVSTWVFYLKINYNPSGNYFAFLKKKFIFFPKSVPPLLLYQNNM